MKKIVLISMVCATLALADAKVYLGLFGGMGSEQFSKPTSDNITSAVGKIDLGYGDYKSYSVEMYLLYNQNSSNHFATNGGKDGTRYSAGLNLVKAFDFGIDFYPLVKVGFGGGFLKSDITTATGSRDSLNFSSLDAGIGFNYLLSHTIVIQVCSTYRHTNYEQVDASVSSESVASNSITTVAGFMYLF